MDDKVEFSLYIPRDLNDWLQQHARSINDSKNHLIYTILQRYQYMAEKPVDCKCDEFSHFWENDGQYQTPKLGQKCLCGERKWEPEIDA